MIETSGVSASNKPADYGIQIGAYDSAETSSFKNIIYDELKRQSSEKTSICDTLTTRIEGGVMSMLERNNFDTQALYSEYSDTKKEASSTSLKDQFKKYKEDQLLSKPGGDNFTINNDNSVDQSKFTKRVGKDLKDAGENFKNIFKDIGTGATIKYVDKDGNIKEGKKVGFAGTVVNFFKDMASGITFGKYTPEGEDAPDNALEATKHFFKKIFVDALFKDAVVGIPRNAIHVGEDAVFACINLAETIPDATIGNCKAGQIVTTEFFDDAQVFIDFVTDVIPMGEAGDRTRAFTFKKGLKGLPFVYNITSPEQGVDDENWKYVRNTPLRKTIESVATFIPIRM
ncbi:MAG TPA: hypothetical protein VI489_02855 [Candidatus Brocadiaceae bacterium]